jgi:hypothetical protein
VKTLLVAFAYALPPPQCTLSLNRELVVQEGGIATKKRGSPEQEIYIRKITSGQAATGGSSMDE